MGSLAHLHADDHLCRPDRALALVQAAQKQLAEAVTIPQVLDTITHADAIIAVTAKLKAAVRIRRLALKIRVQAEIALGKLADSLPLGQRGPQGPHTAQTKTTILNGMGVHRARAAMATRLSKIPKAKVDAIVENVPIRSGITGVMQAAGIAKRWANPALLNSDMAFLAEEAVMLLQRCADTNRAPHVGTVTEMRNRLTTLLSFKKS